MAAPIVIDAENDEGVVPMIKIQIRSPKQRRDYIVSETSTIDELKEKLVVDFSAPYEQQCIIFAGKILNNYERLVDCFVKEGTILHLVIKSANRQSDVSAGQAAEAAKAQKRFMDLTATPFGLGDMGGLDGLSNLGVGSANFIDLQQKLQKEVFRNPALLQSMVNNPLVKEITSSPGLLLQLMMANPHMKELIQSHPEIAETLGDSDLMTKALEIAKNPTNLRDMLVSGSKAMGGQFDTSCLPKVAEQESGDDRDDVMITGEGSTAIINNKSMFSEPTVMSLLQQMVNNPQLVSNVSQSPYMQAMTQYLSANPAILYKMVKFNPFIAGNKDLDKLMQKSIPFMAQQLANPDVQTLMSSPVALDALMEIQEGLQQLYTHAPQLVNSFGIVPDEFDPSTSATGDGSGVSAYTQFLQHVLSTTTANQQTSDEKKYAVQLKQLAVMGFTDSDDSLQALIASGGNVNSAVDSLMQQNIAAVQEPH